MKKYLLVLCLALVSTLSFGQITFEKGYFIKEDDSKVECLIKNMDWKNNPTSFKYKLSEAEEVVDNDINLVKEFGIYGSSKFVRKTVLIDKANENINHLSEVRQAENEEKQVFLKVLIEGLASLYYYDDSFSKKYFISIDNENPVQLLYKKYLITSIKVKANSYYKQQLINTLICDDINNREIEVLEYNGKELISLVNKYNKCQKANFVNYVITNKDSELFNFSIKAGASSASFNFTESGFPVRNYDFGKNLTYRMGVEAELVFPFNKSKWAVVLEPTYQSYIAEINKNMSNSVEVNYKSIEVPVGLRHYFFLNQNNKLFINAAYVIDVAFSSRILFSSGNQYILNTSPNWAFGFGYKLANKYSLELKFQTARESLNQYKNLVSDYSSTSVVLGYTLF